MALLILLIVAWIVIIGYEAKNTGVNAFLWIATAIISYAAFSVTAFFVFISFSPCNPEECKPVLYGMLAGNIMPLSIAVYLFFKKPNNK
ncbi:MAG TPA: hypothetical protein PKY63_05905 [Bacteroidales bacterium]|nr:hypothetical protein [Bacteroidales bacterium]